jgi:hypothetical protein
MAERGQASIELLAAVPAVLVVALLCLQLLATGYAVTVADGAAEAGAIALASGLAPEEAVEAALPGWARDRVGLQTTGGRLTVTLRPPSPLPQLADALEVSSTAWARRPGVGD